MKRIILAVILLISADSYSQDPDPKLIGYWQNWQDPASPYIPLPDIDTSYNIIPVAFAVPAPGSTYNMTFTPDVGTIQQFINDVQSMQSLGKKILISVGGATANIELNDTNQRNIFISSMLTIINTYGFDGMDIDIEGGSLSVTGGTIANPVDARIIHLIYAVKKIMQEYYSLHGRRLILGFAPETAYVQGGMSSYGGIWGAYLPVLHALRDSIAYLHVQLYNSGSMFGIDGHVYTQGTADFILSQTEALLQGFNTQGGFFAPFQPQQVIVGLPACSSASGGGYINPDTVRSAVKYLFGTGPKPANYTAVGTYPGLKGMMDWSVNWDAQVNCHPLYEYARNFDRIFRNTTGITNNTTSTSRFTFSFHPNPLHTGGILNFENPEGLRSVKIYDVLGREVLSFSRNDLLTGQVRVDIPSGTYFLTALTLRGETFSNRMIVIK
ncbi:MAG: T9SS type A sorting domain-containing protein [Ignavibacteriae bacterium]|nr:T9SS type A sorting domain-containing protein [Ignavibacteriota bacterium]